MSLIWPLISVVRPTPTTDLDFGGQIKRASEGETGKEKQNKSRKIGGGMRAAGIGDIHMGCLHWI